MAIEDFEWEGDVEHTRPSRARLQALADTTLALRASASLANDSLAKGWLDGLKRSVWLEPALRLCGVALLLSVLAGIGVVATTYAKPGIKLPEGSRFLTAALGTSWLKPSPPALTTPAAAASAQPSAAPAVPLAAAPATEPVPAAETAPNGAAPAGITPDGKVILNVASADELTKLPGVGMKRAAAIVALRVKLKRFKHPTDLLRVKGIGPRGLQRMLPHLVLDAPA